MARREEWQMQVEVARLFSIWLPGDAFWSAIDATTTSPTTGKMRRLRGCKAGLPDIWIFYSGRLITIELKNPKGGRLSPAQIAVREILLRAGADWFECRSANAVMQAVRDAGVTLNMIAHGDGTIECWQQPELATWEVPRRDPAEPRPTAPEVAGQRRAARQRWRERQLVGGAARRAAAARYEGADGPALAAARKTAS